MGTKVGDIFLALSLNSKSFNKELKGVKGIADNASNAISNSLKTMGKAVIAGFSIKAITDFGKTCLNTATDTTNAWIGLNSIIEGQGKSFSKAQSFIDDYVKDGLVPLNNAVASYKNLALRGYTSDQIEKTMNALKNSATFARQSTYTLGDAVQTATEGLKNENSTVVDNAGVTKNVAKMWEDYAKKIGKTTNNLTQAEKIQAEVNGILEETKFQSNDAAKYVLTFSGRVAQLNSSFTNMKVAIGSVIQPIAKLFIPVVTSGVNAITNLFNKTASFLALFGLKADNIESVSSGFESISGQADSASDSVSAIGDSANKTKKQLQGLRGIDVLNNITTTDSSDSSGSSTGSSGIDLGDSVDLSSGIENQINGINELIGKVNFEPLKNGFLNMLQAIQYFGNGSLKILKGFWENYLKPLGNYVISDALPHFLNSTANAIKKINFDKLIDSFNKYWKALEPFHEKVGNGLLWLYDNVLIPISTWTINDVLPAFLNILSGNLKVLNPILTSFEKIFKPIWENILKPIASWTGGIIVDVLENLGNALSSIGDWATENQETLDVLVGTVTAFFAAWELTNILAFIQMSGGLVACLKALTLGLLKNVAAKIADKMETIALTLMYAKDFVVSIASTTAALVKNAAQWVISTGAKIADAAATTAATAATWLFNAALVVLTSPITLVVLAIGALIAVVVLLVKNWDKVKEAGGKAVEFLKNVWNSVGNWFKDNITEPIKSTFSNLWRKSEKRS